MNKWIFYPLTLVMVVVSSFLVAIVKELTDAPVFMALATVVSAFLILKLPRLLALQNKQARTVGTIGEARAMRVQDRSSETWKYFLIATCVIIIASGLFIRPPSIMTLPAIIGFNLPFALIVWLFFHFAFLRSKVRNRSALCFFVILLATIIASLVAHRGVDTAQGSTSKQTIAHKSETSSPRAQADDIAEAQRLLQVFRSKTESMNKEYHQELNRIGWEGLLEIEKALTGSPEQLKSQLMNVSVIREVANRFKIASELQIHESLVLVRSSGLSTDVRNSFLKALEQRPYDFFLVDEEVWNLELDIIDGIGETLKILDETRGSWDYENEELIFLDDRTLEVYNTSLRAVYSKIQTQREKYRKILGLDGAS